MFKDIICFFLFVKKYTLACGGFYFNSKSWANGKKNPLKDILYKKKKKKVNITVIHNIFITKISTITVKKIFINSL